MSAKSQKWYQSPFEQTVQSGTNEDDDKLLQYNPHVPVGRRPWPRSCWLIGMMLVVGIAAAILTSIIVVRSHSSDSSSSGIETTTTPKTTTKTTTTATTSTTTTTTLPSLMIPCPNQTIKDPNQLATCQPCGPSVLLPPLSWGVCTNIYIPDMWNPEPFQTSQYTLDVTFPTLQTPQGFALMQVSLSLPLVMETKLFRWT